jgi:hypothetical protein
LKLIFIFFLVFTTSLFSQTLKEEISAIDSVFIKHTIRAEGDVMGKSQVLSFFEPDLSSQSIQMSDSINNLKKDYLRKDIGLDFKSNYVKNQKSDLLNLDDNLPFVSRYQSTIEWDLLKSGLFANRKEAKKLDLQSQINNSMNKYATNKNSYLDSYNSIIQSFNNQKSALLKNRENLLSKLNGSLSRLYLSNTLQQNEWFEIQQRLAENKSLNQIYIPYNEVSKSSFVLINNIQFPVFDINEAELMKFQHSFHQDSLEFYFKQINKLSENWLNTVSLSPFTRFNYYNLLTGTEASSRAFMSFGANLSIPLDFNRSKLKSINELEMKQTIESIHNQHQFYYEELANDLYEYRYHLYQYTNLFYKRSVIDDAITIEKIKRELNPANYSPIKACKLVDDYYRIELEMLEVNQKMYLKLLRIHQKNSKISMNDLVKPFDLLGTNKSDSIRSKSVYIWSKTLQKFSPDFLFQYIKMNDFDKVIMAIQEDSISTQNIFCSYLAKNKIEVELMLGSNKAFFEKDFQLYLKNKLANVDLVNVNTIHLDIEPHTFSDWKENKESYLKQYLKIVQEASTFSKSKGVKLSVSIPLYYSEEITKQILETVDLVYFMAYENINEDYILKKIKPYESKYNKIVLAFRTEDFSNRSILDNYISNAISKFNVSKFAIHDLGRLILLDTK